MNAGSFAVVRCGEDGVTRRTLGTSFSHRHKQHQHNDSNRTMKTHRIILILLAISSIAISSASAQMIINGGFETPDTATFITINAGETTISPWVVGLVSVDLADVNNGYIDGAAFDGTQYIDLDGTPGPGQLTQSFRTRPGLVYVLTFAYANNYVNDTSASADVRVFDAMGDLLTSTVTHDTSVPGNLDWTLFRGQFTARKSATSFQITSLSGGGNGGILLDAVSVRRRR